MHCGGADVATGRLQSYDWVVQQVKAFAFAARDTTCCASPSLHAQQQQQWQ
jgi:hypothetical protein